MMHVRRNTRCVMHTRVPAPGYSRIPGIYMAGRKTRDAILRRIIIGVYAAPIRMRETVAGREGEKKTKPPRTSVEKLRPTRSCCRRVSFSNSTARRTYALQSCERCIYDFLGPCTRVFSFFSCFLRAVLHTCSQRKTTSQAR